MAFTKLGTILPTALAFGLLAASPAAAQNQDSVKPNAAAAPSASTNMQRAPRADMNAGPRANTGRTAGPRAAQTNRHSNNRNRWSNNRRGHHRHGWRHHRRGPAFGFTFGPNPYWGDAYGYAPYETYTVSPGDRDVAYCMRRFKSYDPDSGTYLGYDGERHPCP